MSQQNPSILDPRLSPGPKKRFGEVAVEKGLLSVDQLKDGLLTQKKMKELGVPERIGKILVKKGFMSDQQATSVERVRKGNPVLGGFEIIEKIGQGGMGAVYRARQLSMDRIVALKLLPKKMAQNKRFKERFLREARVCGKLNHHNLVNGIECGEVDGHTFFAMEYVDGPTAKALIKKQERLSLEETLSLVRKVASALDYAHRQGVIHRDVKPENILVTPKGDAKLCDLGLARASELESRDGGLTQVGRALGTPHYLSPEQARGQENVDERADIYGLGATIYHLLSGRTLFLGDNANTLMVQQITEQAAALTEVCKDLPIAFGFVVSKMLAKNPDDRYEDIPAFLRDLDAAEAGKAPQGAKGFDAPSTCALPRLAKRGPKRKGRDLGKSTGPRAPISGRGTTGPRVAIGARHTTGPARAVNPIDITTGPASPVKPGRGKTATATRNTEKKKNAGVALMAGIGVAALLVIMVMIGLSGGGKEQPRKTALNSKPKTVKRVAPDVPAPTRAMPIKHAEEKPARPVVEEPSRPAVPAPEAPSPAPVEQTAPVAVEEPIEPEPTQSAPAEEPGPVATETDAKPAVEEVVDEQPASVPPPTAPSPEINQLRARFLAEMLTRTSKMDLTRTTEQLRDLAGKPEYKPARKALQEDLDDLDQALKFESASLKALADKGGRMNLPADMSRTFGATDAKIAGFHEKRGLSVTVKGVGLYLTARMLPIETVLQSKKDLASTLYCIALGAFDGAQQRLPGLPETERKRLEAKLALMQAGRAEFEAAKAFQQVASIAKAKNWKRFMPELAAFTEKHGKSEVAQQEGEKLAAWKAAAEKALEPPNPWKKVFNARRIKPLPNGFVELTYDFSDPRQLADFDCQHGALELKNNWLTVPRGGGEWAQARLRAPMLEIQRITVTGKTLIKAPRFGIYFLKTGETDGGPAPRCICRIYVRKPHLECFEAPVNGIVQRAGVIGKQRVDWTQPLAFRMELQDGYQNWTVADQPLGKAKLPASPNGRHIAFISVKGSHAWANLTVVVKPDPNWAKQELQNRGR